jgi:hypothetical protein
MLEPRFIFCYSHHRVIDRSRQAKKGKEGEKEREGEEE